MLAFYSPYGVTGFGTSVLTSKRLQPGTTTSEGIVDVHLKVAVVCPGTVAAFTSCNVLVINSPDFKVNVAIVCDPLTNSKFKSIIQGS